MPAIARGRHILGPASESLQGKNPQPRASLALDSGHSRLHLNGLHPPGLSIGYQVEHRGLRLNYRHVPGGGVAEDVNELGPLVTTAVHFGGLRHWFACSSCGRRPSNFASASGSRRIMRLLPLPVLVTAPPARLADSRL